MSTYDKKSPADDTKWICLYPAYINSKKTLAEGRRIPKSKAVEKPTCQEIFDILKAGGFTAKVEGKKMFPRDPNRDLNFQGRVRVQLKDETGQPLMASYSTRHQVMLYVAEMIPKLKGRQAKSGGAAANAEAESQNAGGGKKKKK